MPRTLHFTIIAAVTLAVSPVAAVAQSPAPTATATHKHYDVSEHAAQPGPDGQLAPRLQNLGSHTFPVSTRHAGAQRFVNQGLNLAYAFNHAEARRAFREAARLDPSLAMAYWGQALVLGPNINAVMEPNEEPHAYELVQKASSLAAKATPRERALIQALAKRYSGKANDRTTNDAAYAAAMREVQTRFPNDLDIAMLYVESMMDLRPWGYWMPDGRPHEGTAEIIALTEDVMRRNPKHPGAVHMYIHLIEPTTTPERAEKAADTILTLMPAAGHMIHMASHIYQRVGRYADAMKSNQLAIAADEDYITQCRAQGLYPMAYYPHNIHFLWFAASVDGQSKAAFDAGQAIASKIPDATLAEMPLTAGFRVVPYWTNLRFGRWDAILAEPAPPKTNVFLTGAWHYARGQAFVATNRVEDAAKELGALEALISDPQLDAPLFSPNLSRTILAIGPPTLAGEIAAARGDYATAIAKLEHAVRLEDALVYTEPFEWAFPSRHVLGALLLEAGTPAEAETVYWEDLKRNRENAWALAGLAQALRAQKKDAHAAIIDARLAKATARADVRIATSRFGRTPATSATAPARIAATPAAHAPKTVTLASGIVLPYVEGGRPDGTPVIFLHGYSDSWRSFDETLRHLPDSIRALAITQRGHGEASKPAEGYRMADLAGDVAGFMDALGIRSAIIVGHSMGGLVAQRFALDYPTRTRGLVLLATMHTIKGHPDVQAMWDGVIRDMRDPVDRRFAHEFQASTVASPLPPSTLDQYVDESMKVPARVWRALCEAFLTEDATSELPRIAAPTVVISAGKDGFSRPQERHALLQHIRNATAIDYPDLGHALHWEAPAAIAGDISRFVARVTTSDSREH